MGLSTPVDCRVFDVQRFSIHDGPGIRTTVFLEGCPLRCAWCQNPESFGSDMSAAMTPSAVIDEVVKDQAYYAVSGGGLTVSGGEPLLRLAPIRALLQAAKERGLHTCVQTSGAVPLSHVAEVLDLVDLFQFDLKHMDTARHQRLTGVGTQRIHANAVFLLDHGASVQFRMPLIPGINDDAENLDAVAQFLLSHGVSELRVVPYHRLYVDKYRALGREPELAALQPPTDDVVQGLVRRMARHGVVVAVDG